MGLFGESFLSHTVVGERGHWDDLCIELIESVEDKCIRISNHAAPSDTRVEGRGGSGGQPARQQRWVARVGVKFFQSGVVRIREKFRSHPSPRIASKQGSKSKSNTRSTQKHTETHTKRGGAVAAFSQDTIKFRDGSSSGSVFPSYIMVVIVTLRSTRRARLSGARHSAQPQTHPKQKTQASILQGTTQATRISQNAGSNHGFHAS